MIVPFPVGLRPGRVFVSECIPVPALAAHALIRFGKLFRVRKLA